MTDSRKTVLITGATSGIGKASAERLASESYRLILCGRRRDRLDELKAQLSAKTEVHTLVFDVRKREEVEDAIRNLPEAFQKIDILLNNAGNAHGLDPIQSGNYEDWDAMMDINVKGLLYVSKEVIPQFVERNEGHIINIGSTAGKEVYPNGNVYCASKHAVDALNHGMRIDLNKHNIRVGAIHPGLVETEFSEVRFKGDQERAAKVYQGYRPLKPEDIADIIAFVISRPYHVNIADLMVMSVDQANSTIVNKG